MHSDQSSAEEEETPQNNSPTKAFSPVGNKDEKDKETRVRKIVRKPQPKLDTTRLIGERGIKSIMSVFQEVKFKGDGHEFRDLDLLISKYKLWAHRLFPKMTFEEVLERVEKLVDKREVKHCLNRIMMDEDQIESTTINEEDDDLRRIIRANNQASDDEFTSTVPNTMNDIDEDEAFYNAINMYNI